MLTVGVSTRAASLVANSPRSPPIFWRNWEVSSMRRFVPPPPRDCSARRGTNRLPADLDHRLARAAEAHELELVAVALRRERARDGVDDGGVAARAQRAAQGDGVVVGE